MKYKSYLLLLSLIAIALSSCQSHNHLSYFNDLKEIPDAVIPANIKPITLQPQDELRITVSALNPLAAAPYNLVPYTSVEKNDIRGGEPQYFTYVVDNAGDIDFPMLGKIHVEGLTTDQLKAELTRRIGESVKDPLVSVSLVNFRVKVMGEVARPGFVTARNERFTVLDALASVGDLTQYSRRDNILVIRQNPDGTSSTQTLDLRDKKIFESPYFVLQQNDIIYVTPNKIKQDNSTYNSSNGFKLSVISTVVSATSVVVTLIIALTR